MIRYPEGYSDKPGYIKIAVSFPEQLFMDIISMAQHDKKQFSQMVSELCEVGILDLTESDRLEPAE